MHTSWLYLTQHEQLSAVMSAHVCASSPQVISELVEQCGVSDIKEDKLFSTLRAMGDTIAVCDKLLRYPLPLAWSRHTSRCDGMGQASRPCWRGSSCES